MGQGSNNSRMRHGAHKLISMVYIYMGMYTIAYKGMHQCKKNNGRCFSSVCSHKLFLKYCFGRDNIFYFDILFEIIYISFFSNSKFFQIQKFQKVLNIILLWQYYKSPNYLYIRSYSTLNG